MHQDDISVVVAITTIGRIEALKSLLMSVADQLTINDVISVVAQRDSKAVGDLCRSMSAETSARIVMSESRRGISLGRNTAVRAAGPFDSDPIILFPNDTSRYEPGAIGLIKSRLVGQAGAGVEISTDIGARFTIPRDASILDSKLVWKVIEPGLVLRHSVFVDVGGFSENFGSGADTPWQAGEGADLLLRILARDASFSRKFEWLFADSPIMSGLSETAALEKSERRQKLRAYGRGVGRVYGAHHMAWPRGVRFAAAGALVGIRRPQEYQGLDGAWGLLGRVEGLIGLTIRGRSMQAVDR